MSRTSRVMTLVLGVGLVLFGAGTLQAMNFYVAQEGQVPVTPYTNWVMAASNIQDAVAAAWYNEPNTVWVRPGRYTATNGTVVAYGQANVVRIKDPVSLRATSSNPADTIIDGGGVNRGILVADEWRIATYGPTLLIDGFTISNGYSSGSGGTGGGGGICLQGNGYAWTAVIKNCVIQDNTGTASAGGVHAYTYNGLFGVVVSNCTIRRNSGGGLFASLNQTATARGSVRMDRCQVEDNAGIGIYLTYGGTNEVVNTTIKGNNNSGAYASGVMGFAGGTHRLRNCLLKNNYCGGAYGGAVGSSFSGAGSLELYNCTIVSNGAAGGPAGSYVHWNGLNILVNCIVYSNFVSSTHNNWGGGGGLTYMTNCCTTPITGLSGGANNTASGPAFLDFAAQDFHLTRASPCLNTGMNQEWMVGATDLDGLPRLDVGSLLVDMGCYELIPPKGTILYMH